MNFGPNLQTSMVPVFWLTFVVPTATGAFSSLPSLLASRVTAPRRRTASEKGYMSSFIDIGANLLDPCFRGRYHGGSQKHEPDLESVIERASAAGVEKMIVTAGSLEESREALELVRHRPNLYSTVGVHPTRCSEFFSRSAEAGGESADPEAHVAALAAVLEEGKSMGKRTVKVDNINRQTIACEYEKVDEVMEPASEANGRPAGEVVLHMNDSRDLVVAVGECGLDYDRLQFCSKEEQARGFELQFELAERSRLPVFFHSRACKEDFADLVRRNRDRVSGGVVHSFTGTQEEALELVSMGFYIGINGCSLKTPENLEVVKSIPAESLMLETDAPWCEIRPTHAGYGMIKTSIPSRKREKFEPGMCVKGRQEPCHIVQVLEVVAATHGEDTDVLASQVLENTRRLFFPESA